MAPSFFDSIAAYFFKKTPQLHPVSGRFWVSGNSTSHPFLKQMRRLLITLYLGTRTKERGDRYLLQAVDIVLRHLGTAFAIHTRRNDATGIACSFATREKPPQAHVLQGFAVA